jgi:hypothetical protein
MANEEIYGLDQQEAPQETLVKQINSDPVIEDEVMAVEEGDTTEEVENEMVQMEFIKSKRDTALVNIQKLVAQRQQVEQKLQQINLMIGKQKSYIEAWNDLLTEELRNDLPEEIVNMLNNG